MPLPHAKPEAPIAANLWLASLLGALALFALFVLPTALLPRDPKWAVALLPIALSTNTLWALLHEAIHGHFAPEKRLNERAGRVLALALGSSFRVLRFGHLMHHRFNRYALDRPDTYDPARQTRTAAKIKYLGHILAGLHLAEAATPFLFLLPRAAIERIIERIYRGPDPTVRQVGQVARNSLAKPKAVGEIRRDALTLAAMLALSAVCYGPYWPFLVGFWLARAAALSLGDNVAHFGTPLDEPRHAWNLRLPAPLRLWILNTNLHRVHHGEPHLPWRALPARFAQLGETYDRGYFAALVAQLRGPAPLGELRSGAPQAGTASA